MLYAVNVLDHYPALFYGHSRTIVWSLFIRLPSGLGGKSAEQSDPGDLRTREQAVR
jgi:hypothetical protein